MLASAIPMILSESVQHQNEGLVKSKETKSRAKTRIKDGVYACILYMQHSWLQQIGAGSEAVPSFYVISSSRVSLE